MQLDLYQQLRTRQERRRTGRNFNVSLWDRSGNQKHETITVRCKSCGQFIRVTRKCGDRSCSTCRLGEYSRLFRSYERMLESIPKEELLFVTLTLRRGLQFKKQLIRLRASLKKLLRRKLYEENWKGGLYVIEVKNVGKGWGVHLHMLVHGRWIPKSKLRQDWAEISGDSDQVDIQIANNPKRVLRYNLKAILTQTVAPEYKSEFNIIMRGKRLVQCFGSFFGRKRINMKRSRCFHSHLQPVDQNVKLTNSWISLSDYMRSPPERNRRGQERSCTAFSIT